MAFLAGNSKAIGTFVPLAQLSGVKPFEAGKAAARIGVARSTGLRGLQCFVLAAQSASLYSPGAVNDWAFRVAGYAANTVNSIVLPRLGFLAKAGLVYRKGGVAGCAFLWSVHSLIAFLKSRIAPRVGVG